MPAAPPGTGPTMVNLPEKPGMRMTELERTPEQEFSQFAEAYRRLKEAAGRQPIGDQPAPQNDSAPDQTQAQYLRKAKIDQSPRDAGGLLNGEIVSSIGPPRTHRGNDAITTIYTSSDYYPYNQDGGSATGGIPPWDSNLHLVGEGDSPSDLSRLERHKLGVR